MSKYWYSLSEASRILGRSRNYTSVWLKRHGSTMPKEMTFEIGGKKVISQEGVEFIKSNAKKAGDHLRAVTLNVVYKANGPICFYPKLNYIKIAKP